MRNIILISGLMFFAHLSMAKDKPSSLFKTLKERIEANNALQKSSEKDYVLFLDSEGNNLETSITTNGTEWLEENIVDLVPFRDELRDLLNEYNELPSPNMNNEKVQHYVMVVDVAPALFTRITGDNSQEPHYLDKSPVNYFSMSVTEDVTYNTLLRDAKMNAIDDFKSTFDKAQLTVADQNANLYVSIFVVDRKIEFGMIKELVFTYDDVFAEFSSNTFSDIIEDELKPEVAKISKVGFSFINQFVQQFINTFHGVTPYISTNCANAESMGFESNLGEDFYSYYCSPVSSPEYDIEAVYFKEIVYRCAKYLDYLHVYYGIATTNNNQAMLDYLGSDFLTEWDAMLREFVETYYNSGMDQKFAIYFKNNYRNLFKNFKGDPDYTLIKFDLLFVDLFFKPSDLIGEEMYNKVLLDFTAMNNGDPTEWVSHGETLKPYYEYKTPAGAERVTDRLYQIITQAYDPIGAQLFTAVDRDNIYNLLVQNEKLLWDFYLNPEATGIYGLGLKVTRLAEAIGNFLQTHVPISMQINQNDWKEYLDGNVPYVLTGFTKTFRNVTKAKTELDVLSEITTKYIAPTDPDDDATLDFNIKVASNYVWELQGKVFVWKPIFDQNSYQFSLEGEEAVEFFSPIGNLKINTPTYYNSCVQCKQPLAYEYAFVTATRIREDALDDKVNKAILAVELASLPFAFAEYAAAQGMLRIVRGLLLAVDLEAVGISAIGGGDFEEGCNKVFGPALGPQIFPYLNTMNAVVGFGQLTEGIGAGGIKILKAFQYEDLANAAAGSSYLTKTKEYLGVNANDIISPEQYNEIRTVRSQIETNLGINGADGFSDYIDDIIDEFLGFEPGGGSSALRTNEKFEELMIKYQYWKKDFDPNAQGADDILHANEFLQDISQGNEIIEGLSPAERDILDAMLTDELGDIIIDSFEPFDVVKNSHKMKALKKLAKNNVCQL